MEDVIIMSEKKLFLVVLLSVILLVSAVPASASGEESEFVTWGSMVTDDGKVHCPQGVAIDASGNVYVADTNNDRIQKFASDGTFIMKWGEDGSGDGEFHYPKGVAADNSGNVYVVDSWNNCIQKFGSDGTFITKWGPAGNFGDPCGITVDSSGNVYVADPDNENIQKFGSDGTFIRKWYSSPGGGWLHYPYGVVIDASGTVFVVDSGNDCIQKFIYNGTFLSKWGSRGSGNGQFNDPCGIAVDGSGNVYVADTKNNRIQKFASDGTFIMKWGEHGSGDGEFDYPKDVAADVFGNVYVADTNSNCIQKFAFNGLFITKWGSKGSGDGQFDNPRGVAVDGSGNVYVADTYNDRIQKFASDGTFIMKWGKHGSGDGEFHSPEGVAIDGSGNIYVTDTDNERIQKLKKSDLKANFSGNTTQGTLPLTVQFTDMSTGGATSWTWDFCDGNTSTEQHPVHTYTASGNYSVNLTVFSDESGSASICKSNYISVTAEPAATSALWNISTIPGTGNLSGLFAIPEIGDGDTIRIWGAEGHTYEGGITISAPDVTIEQWLGSPAIPLITNTTGNEHAISVTADNVTLHGLNISGNTLAGDGAGVRVLGTNDDNHLQGFTITDCVFTGNEVTESSNRGGGLSLYYVDDARVTGTIFEGNAADLDGGGAYFKSSDYATLTSNTFTNNTADYGGGVYFSSSANPTLTSNTFTNNTIDYRGGGAHFSSSADPTLTSNTFTNNMAHHGGGGAHFSLSAHPTLTNNTFANNTAQTYGGGASFKNSDGVILTGTTFKNNTVNYGRGGGAYFEESDGVLNGNTFESNTAEGEGGGGAFFVESEGVLNGNAFESNTAGKHGGGALFVCSEGIILNGNAFESNTAGKHGGGAYFEGSDCAILNGTTFENNTAEEYGGGVFFAFSDGADLNGTAFENNTAEYGGGAYFNDSENIILNGTTFESNTAEEDGGGAYFYDSDSVNLNGNTFESNTAEWDGGGAYFDEFDGVLNGNTFESNAAGWIGGGAEFQDSDNISLANTVFANNTAGWYGGGAEFWDSDNVSLADTVFANNTAELYGGGAEFWDSDSACLNNTIFRNNTVEGYSEDVALYTSGSSNLTDRTVERHTGSSHELGTYPESSENAILTSSLTANALKMGWGGGVDFFFSDSPTLTNTIIVSNTAKYGGGAYFWRSENTSLADTVIVNNTAEAGGGALFEDSDGVTLSDTIIESNTAEAGGGVYTTYGELNVQNSILSNNTANEHGGGLFAKNSSLSVIDNIFRNDDNLYVNTTGSAYALNSVYNHSLLLTENIAGGPYLGGNVWTNPAGTGFSQTQSDSDFDGICDDTYVINDSTGTVAGADYLPLYYNNSRGTVLVSSTPQGADVLLNSVSYNHTTPSEYYLPPGSYSVELTLPGYFGSPAIPVSVTTGCEESIDYNFTRIGFRHTDTGPSPLHFVANLTTQAPSDVTSFTWQITSPNGSVTESAGRNISTVLVTTGNYSVTLCADSTTGNTARSEPVNFSVRDPVPDPVASEKTTVAINGTTVVQTPAGTQTISVNESAAGNVTNTSTSITVLRGDGTTVDILTTGTTSAAGNLSGTVRSVTVTPPVLNATISDTVGNASVGLAMTMDTYDEDATITTEIAAGCAADAKNAFSLACPNLNQVAYTVYFTKSGFDNESAISGAVLNFSVNTSWVTSMGGPGMITIIRWTDDGNSTQITPTYLGISGGESLFQVVTDGFSVYGVASTSASSSGGSSGSGGTSSVGVAATSDLKAGEITTLSLKNTAVTQVGILPAVNIKDLMITVENKYGPESGILPPDETVYQYDLVTLYKADANDIAEITYTFEIPKDWLSVQHALPALWQYNTTAEEWIAYATHIIGDDAFAVISEATCPDVGWIALGGVPGEMVPEDTEEIIIVAEDGEGGNTPKETSPEPEETASPFGVAGLLVGLGAAAMLRRKI